MQEEGEKSTLLNSKAEYRRYTVTRLTTKMGNADSGNEKKEVKVTKTLSKKLPKGQKK